MPLPHVDGYHSENHEDDEDCDCDQDQVIAHAWSSFCIASVTPPVCPKSAKVRDGQSAGADVMVSWSSVVSVWTC